MKDLVIFSGNSNPDLSQKICQYLDQPLGGAKVKTFSDGEIQIEIDENIRQKDVFIIQSTCSPVNDNLVELLLMIDACNRSSAKRITAVLPYYGYARQDKKVAPRVPISAKLVADLLTVAGTKRVITLDLHAGQIQGFFNIPVDNLFAAPVLIDHDELRLVWTREADFGADTHRWGEPSAPASIAWYGDTVTRFQFVNGRLQRVQTPIQRVEIFGVLYWDALHTGCARVSVVYQDSRSNTLGIDRDEVCGPGWDANSPANFAVVDLDFAHPDLRSVNITVAVAGGRSESAIRYFGDTATRQ